MTQGSTRREFLTTLGGATLALSAPLPVQGLQTDASDWPMLGFDSANSGYNPDAVGPRSAIGQRWGFETGAGITTSPAVVDGICYFGSWDGTIYAVNTDDGELAWQFGTSDDVRSSPTVVDGTVYVGSSDGFLYALDASTGDAEWEFETGGPIVSSPAVVDETVYVGSTDTNVYAVDANDGDERWVYETDGPVQSSPAITEVDTQDEDVNMERTVVVGSDDRFVYALDAATGEDRWRWETAGEIPGGPAVDDGTVFVGSLDGHVYALDSGDGEPLWRLQTGGAVVASPAVANDRVYVPSRRGVVYALASETGEIDWQADVDLPTDPPTVAGDVVLVSGERTVAGFDAATGDPLWSLEASQPSPAIVANEEVYVSSGFDLFAVAEGFDEPITAPPVEATQESEDGPLTRLRFLLWPAAAIASVATLFGIAYAAKRSGLLDWVETTMDDIETDPAGDGQDAPPEGRGGGDGTGTGVLPVWDLVVDDVIGRAEETDRTATKNLLVTKYVDADTLESPVVAYEIESVRDDPARVQITEPVSGDGTVDARPMGEDWSLTDEHLRFEGQIEPGATIRTLVGRPDWPADRIDELLDEPVITVME